MSVFFINHDAVNDVLAAAIYSIIYLSYLCMYTALDFNNQESSVSDWLNL